MAIITQNPTGKDGSSTCYNGLQIDNYSLKDFLPEEYRTKDADRKTLEEWKKLNGLNDLNARFRYIQYCRSLKKYPI
jgi:hypothetical protein